VDRAAAGISGRFSFAPEALSAVQAGIAEKKGLIVLSAHTGTRHMGPTFLAGHAAVPIHVLGVRDREDVDKEAHEHRGQKAPYDVIGQELGPLGSVQLMNILRRGEILCMMGDRVFGIAGSALPVNFLGAPAPLPYLAFRLASASGALVLIAFNLRTGTGRGTMRLADIIRVPACIGNDPEAYRPYVQRFAKALEGFTAEYPYQFFNFFNLWET
jgi:predicted LPLAT superfamily acyltransferase